MGDISSLNSNNFSAYQRSRNNNRYRRRKIDFFFYDFFSTPQKKNDFVVKRRARNNIVGGAFRSSSENRKSRNRIRGTGDETVPTTIATQQSIVTPNLNGARLLSECRLRVFRANSVDGEISHKTVSLERETNGDHPSIGSASCTYVP